MAVVKWSKQPTDWIKVEDVGIEVKRATGMDLVSGCMRLWVWLSYRGVRCDD